MLAFDIETTGLSALNGDVITVICTEDYHTRQKHAYEFARHRNSPDTLQALTDTVIAAFDAAPALCAFNGHKFDIPFMATALSIPYEKVRAWKNKMTDILEHCRDKYQHTFSLNLLCEWNCIPIKISTGLAAVKMALDGEFDQLKEYCEYDVTILNNLYAKRFILNPRNNAVMDLAIWAPYLFPEAEDETPTQKLQMQLDAKNALDYARRRPHGQLEATPVSPESPRKRCRLDLPHMLEG